MVVVPTKTCQDLWRCSKSTHLQEMSFSWRNGAFKRKVCSIDAQSGIGLQVGFSCVSGGFVRENNYNWSAIASSGPWAGCKWLFYLGDGGRTRIDNVNAPISWVLRGSLWKYMRSLSSDFNWIFIGNFSGDSFFSRDGICQQQNTSGLVVRLWQ